MSKSKYGNSNLYMNTREFADLVINALEEQNYFKKDDVAHPQDIAYAFSTVGETIGTAMSWAIKEEHTGNNKQAVMTPKNLKKSHAPEPALLYPGEPVINDESVGYFESKAKGYL